MQENCVFCKIAARQIPVTILFENDEFLAFRDAHPVAPVHILIIPKLHYETFLDVKDSGILGRALLAVQQVARELKIDDSGFRMVINCREDGGQTVFHLHFHVLGGRFMQWPPG